MSQLLDIENTTIHDCFIWIPSEKLIVKAVGNEISYPCIELKTICDAGSKGAGGLCDCTKLDGWTKGKWEKPICSQGECRARQKQYEFCKGSSYKHPNGKPLGDGTWCRNGHFFSICLTIAGKSL